MGKTMENSSSCANVLVFFFEVCVACSSVVVAALLPLQLLFDERPHRRVLLFQGNPHIIWLVVWYPKMMVYKAKISLKWLMTRGSPSYIGVLIIPPETSSYFSEGWLNHQPEND